MKHATVRLAWQDSKWDGKVCKDPQGNFYCRNNYLLLSPRIQKRIRLDIEESMKGKHISETIAAKHHIPPCYWTINAVATNDYQIQILNPSTM